MLMPYFGGWPEWIKFYFKTCETNNTIDFVFFTDCEIPRNIPNNMKFIKISFYDYKMMFSRKLNINVEKITPYKICDFRPMFGFVHNDIIDGYDFFGYGDIDVVYGNLRKFLNEDVLKNKVISTHSDRLSGHFALIENSEKYRNAFFNIPNWKKIL